MLELGEGPDEYLKMRFEALATKAGIALGCPEDWPPLKFWLFKLFLYLSETKSHYLFASTPLVRIDDNPRSDLLKPHADETVSARCGIITNVYEASANFCLWLERQALEAGAAPRNSATQVQLNDHEEKVWGVIQRGGKGLQYCRELDKAGIAPLRSGVWQDCPSRKYESAYREGKPWPHRIQDEKSKVRRKAKLAGLAKLASE